MTRVPPRPTFARPSWEVLDGPWGFAADDEDKGVDGRWFETATPFDRTIVVPYPPEASGSGIGEDGHRIVWYRREVVIARPLGDRRVLLHFEAIDFEADVWVNGQHVGHHVGGQTPIDLDITAALSPQNQVIVVRARDEVDLDQPRGKQDWGAPHAIWYGRTTGLWRRVWWEEVAASHLSSLELTPAGELDALDIQAEVAGSGGAWVEIEVGGVPGLSARSRHRIVEGRLRINLALDQPLIAVEPERFCWSPDHPNLLDVTVRLFAEDGEQLDEVTSYFGLRSIRADGASVLLNGRPYFLRMVLEQGFWPGTHLAIPSDDAVRAEVQAIKDLGFNGVRVHQHVADPHFLYWCDRLGLVAWVESAAAYRFSPTALRHTVADWMEIVRACSPHPSVIAWVAFNESWGVPRLAMCEREQSAVVGLAGLLRALDPSRLVIGNDGWECLAGDVIGVHDYSQDPDELRARYGDIACVSETVAGGRPAGRLLVIEDADRGRDLPVVLSEYGGVSLDGAGGDWEGYGHVDSPAELLERVRSLTEVVAHSPGLAGYCYTQLTDTGLERNGLLTADRQPKADIAALRACFTTDQRL